MMNTVRVRTILYYLVETVDLAVGVLCQHLPVLEVLYGIVQRLYIYLAVGAFMQFVAYLCKIYLIAVQRLVYLVAHGSQLGYGFLDLHSAEVEILCILAPA